MIQKCSSWPWAFLFYACAISWPSLGARAVALPPRPVDRSYDFFKDIRPLNPVQAQAIELLSSEPVLNSAFRLEAQWSFETSQALEHGLSAP
jgi:hypothetical protein